MAKTPAPQAWASSLVGSALDVARTSRTLPVGALLGLSGHGHFDMSAYDAYFAGKLEDIELSQSRIDAAIEELPKVPAMS